MGKLTWTSTNRRGFTIAIAALAVLLSADVLYQLGNYVIWRRWITRSMSDASATTQPAKAEPASNEIAEDLRKRSVFTPPRPTGHGLSLTGVIGNIALFQTRDGQTVGIAEGKSERGITVKSIKDYEVVIDYQGKSETMSLFSGSGSGGGGGGGRRGRGGPMMPEGMPMMPTGQPVMMMPEGGPAMPVQVGKGMSQEDMKKLMESRRPSRKGGGEVRKGGG